MTTRKSPASRTTKTGARKAGTTKTGTAKAGTAARPRKAATPKRAPAKPAVIPTNVTTLSPAVSPISGVVASEPVVASAIATVPMLRKKELFERVAALTGAKKRDVKPIVDAALRIIGDALSAGETLTLPPLGKVKVNRQKDLPSGEMMVIKLRRPGEMNTAIKRVDTPLAEDGD